MKRPALLLTLLVGSAWLVSCGKTVASPAPASEISPAAPAQPSPAAPVEGLLLDPTSGLAHLPAYRAELEVSFSGEQGSDWSHSYSLTVSAGDQARWLAYTEHGFSDRSPQYPSLVGVSGEVYYYQAVPASGCVANFIPEDVDLAAALPEPAALLPVIPRLGDPEGAAAAVNGVQAQAYPLSAGSFNASGQQVSGQVWLDQADRRVVRYSLQVQGGPELFGPQTAGRMTWEYNLTPLDADRAFLPPGCPPPLPFMALMPGASQVTRFPGYVSYEISAERQPVLDFYHAQLSGLGYQPLQQARGDEFGGALTYTRGEQAVQVVFQPGPPAQVVVYSRPAHSDRTAEAGQNVSTPVPPSQPVLMADRIASSLEILLGDERTPPAFPGFHLESTDRSPAWNNQAESIGERVTRMSADVAGLDVHFTNRIDGPGQYSRSSEVYIIGADEYEVKDGQLQTSFGLAGLAWTTYPLDVTMLLSLGVLEAAPAGEDTFAGREAEVYTLKGASQGVMAGLPVTSVDGQVWIDRQTGALLRLEVAYEALVRSSAGEQKGSGSGSFLLEVSQVGEVQVSLP